MLLNDILDLSKIEAGKLHLDKRNFNPRELMDSVELIFRASAQNRGLDFRVIYMSSLPLMIRTDSLRIRQCLVNLTGNAIKYTQQGHVYICVSYENERLKLAVEDTGIGISQLRLESIFNAFTQEEPGQESEFGSGLGLAITRQLTRLMGGEVSVQSQVGKGSVFTLEFPVETIQDKMHTVPDVTETQGGWGDL
jgi:two-component system CheB/CheR fusion protein